MTITQTVEIPSGDRRIIEVPKEVPSGRVVLTFTPLPETIEFADATKEEVIAAGDEILDKHISAFRALAK